MCIRDRYLLIESVNSDSGLLRELFGYKQKGIEPRLHEMEYSRELHEQLEKIKGKLQRGEPVLGSLKPSEKGKGKPGDGDPENENGDGSESQKQQWEFHELRPSDFLNKPTD